MAKHLLKNDISELLEMIQYQYTIIGRYEGKIPQIEMDIIMGNIRKLYEDFFELNRLNQQYRAESVKEPEKFAPPAEKEHIPVPEPEIPAIEPPSQDLSTRKLDDTIEEKPVQHAEKREPPKSKEAVKQSPKKGVTADLFSGVENNTVSDKFKNQKKSVHDKIASEKKEKTVAEMIGTPIADLKTGIGVNDRFLFINDLFKGSQQDYMKAIQELNAHESLDDALARAESLKQQYHWDEMSESYNRFVGFIRRRFA